MLKKTLLFTLVAGLALPMNLAHGAQLQSFMTCSQIKDNVNRLACFDDISSKVKLSNLPPSKAQKVENFGKAQLRSSPIKKIREDIKKEEKKDLDEVTLNVRKLVFTTTNNFVLFMENGQVWKQKNSGTHRFPKGKFSVTIKKGALGSYNMRVPNKKAMVKVKRIK